MERIAVILAAGDLPDESDLNPRLLLTNPNTKKTILETFTEAYQGNCIFVLGFRALSILSKYPDLNAIINYDWSSTKSA